MASFDASLGLGRGTRETFEADPCVASARCLKRFETYVSILVTAQFGSSGPAIVSRDLTFQMRSLILSDLNVHLDTENISRTVRLRCHFCGWDFCDKSTKNRHLKRIHGQSREDRQEIELQLRQMKKSWVAPRIEAESSPSHSLPITPVKPPTLVSDSHPPRRRRRLAKRRRLSDISDISRDDAAVLMQTSQPVLHVRPELRCLPTDILAQILARLRARPLLRASATCHALADAVSASDLWRRLFLAHCDSPPGAAALSPLRIPHAVWRGLYRAMFLAHISARRGRRTGTGAARGTRCDKGAAAAAWRCPAGRCAASFRTQAKLLAHVARHFPAAAGRGGC